MSDHVQISRRHISCRPDSRRDLSSPTAARRAFTLVELLVVIGIIALLISVLLPALGKARQQAAITKCSAQLRNIGQTMFVYASQNRGKLPQHAAQPVWLWDISRETRDVLAKAGSTRNVLYCPTSFEQNVDALWEPSFNATISVLGYCFMTQRLDANYKPLAMPYISNRYYLTKITDRITPEMVSQANTPGAILKTAVDATGEKPRVMVAADLEVACDAVISGGQVVNGEPVGGYAASGAWADKHVTSHMRGSKPFGGNVLFLDGHVIFRPWKDMFHRTTMGSGPQTIRFYY